QLVIRVVASFGEEPLAIAHFEATLYTEALSVGIGFQAQKRWIRRDDRKLFRQRYDLIANCIAGALLQQMIEMGAGPESRDERVAGFRIFEIDPGRVTN